VQAEGVVGKKCQGYLFGFFAVTVDERSCHYDRTVEEVYMRGIQSKYKEKV
jgi:hypothetical protein